MLPGSLPVSPIIGPVAPIIPVRPVGPTGLVVGEDCLLFRGSFVWHLISAIFSAFQLISQVSNPIRDRLFLRRWIRFCRFHIDWCKDEKRTDGEGSRTPPKSLEQPMFLSLLCLHSGLVIAREPTCVLMNPVRCVRRCEARNSLCRIPPSRPDRPAGKP
jgi:hypothetical protein